jgi:carotenoid cleavage dioxygenase-like enzyme
MNLTAKKIPSADSTGAPYVAGNFAPLKSEVTAFDLEVIGHVPEALTGRFLRIGPNPIDDLNQVRLVRHHWFAGTGMAHGLRLRRGKAESRLDYSKAAPGSVQAMYKLQKYVDESGLEHSLLELVKTRVSQKNGSAFCIDMHTSECKFRKQPKSGQF